MSDGNTEPGDSDVYVERSSQSWFGRLGDAFKSILFGIVLVIAASILLFWNEGRAAKTAAALAEGAGLVASVEAGAADPAREGKLIHISGAVTLGAPAEDTEFRLHANALKLDRKVEMYQWKEEKQSETHDKLGGGQETITRYAYSRVWSDRAIDSNQFHEVSHRNPPLPNVRSHDFFPKNAKLGAFALGEKVLSQLSPTEPFSAPDAALADARAMLGARAQIANGGVFAGAEPDRPQIGDVRVKWRIAPAGEVSVVGAQTHNSLSPYVASNGEEVLLVEPGDVDARLMFKHGEEANSFLTWILRSIGVVIMLIGFRVAIDLIVVLADVVPLFGAIVGAGATLVAFFCTLLLAPLIIAIAWLAYRPFVALGVLVVGAALAYAFHALARRRAPPRPA